MDVDFRGAEFETPLGGVSVGRGYTQVAGEGYFVGLAVNLPVGRFRFGWRTWKAEGELTKEEARKVRARDWASLLRHILTYIGVMLVVSAFLWALGRLDIAIWVLAIWGAIVVLQGFLLLVSVVVDWAEQHLLRDQLV